MLKNEEGIPGGIIENAHSQANIITENARLNAEHRLSDAQQDRETRLADAQEQASIIIRSVHGYYYNSDDSLMSWIPSKGSKPEPIYACSLPISDICFDEENEIVLWANKLMGTIMTSNTNKFDPQVLYHCDRPSSVTADPQSNAIFWISDHRRIMTGDIEGDKIGHHLNLPVRSRYRNVENLKLVSARDAKDDLNLFWADGANIFRSTTAGEYEVIYNSIESKPIYLAVDRAKLVLYWMDFQTKAICSCDFNGENYEEVFSFSSPGFLTGLAINSLAGHI